HRELDAGALHHMGDRAVTDLAVRRMLAMQQGIDHRIFKMRPTPPGHKRVRIALPAFVLEKWRGDGRQPPLHIDHRSVLIEHAHLDVGPDRFVAHVVLLMGRTVPALALMISFVKWNFVPYRSVLYIGATGGAARHLSALSQRE